KKAIILCTKNSSISTKTRFIAPNIIKMDIKHDGINQKHTVNQIFISWRISQSHHHSWNYKNNICGKKTGQSSCKYTFAKKEKNHYPKNVNISKIGKQFILLDHSFIEKQNSYHCQYLYYIAQYTFLSKFIGVITIRFPYSKWQYSK